ncbi:hypothetical protein KC343_g7197 [Hortaea werneckii]|uniref:Uncharacterized protein n=1 Tax=Hortaea werneckii TaxID=91943 RepID=A0A3M7E8C3_HORWE|nr:hypothetical protein KC338_g4971 [Hortaea werneckii]KAI7564252.1 hypothetical protein KC317_g7186 [Hortaea werneckii]KAI7623222.1 hypothetical protein KC346_g2836 [Hortaea werneckii]KAI7623773.1 hypothetical protein KC343_g7197 [Hortaea werneckii]KAI7682192.1 hypothetical protein KC319_g1147 [Hortaea werneckii]
MNEPPRRHHPHSSRKRSRSPREHPRDHNVTRQRSRSPHRRHHHHPPNEHGHRHHHHHHHHHRSKHPSPHPVPTPVSLPFHARPLHKRDLDTHRALFASYLDLQKGLDLDTLSADEARGRWKSFVGKWNRGTLAEGWYDPETKRKVDGRIGSGGGGGEEGEEEGEGRTRIAGLEELAGTTPAVGMGGPGADGVESGGAHGEGSRKGDDEDDDEEDEDEYGPSLPTSEAKAIGPAAPSTQDLQHRQELLEEDREAHRARIREDRKQDRKVQKERLEELVPRAEPGTRERQLEKKREKASANRDFRDAKDGGEGGGMEEVGDKELMGGGEGGEDDYKAQIRARERQKNQREIRKEEVLRARAAEREGRVAEHRRKEERTMGMLRELAKQRFGS